MVIHLNWALISNSDYNRRAPYLGIHSPEVNWLDRTWGDQIPLGLPSKVLTVQPLSFDPSLLPRRLCFWSTAHYLQIQYTIRSSQFDLSWLYAKFNVVLPSLILFFPKTFPFILPESKAYRLFLGQGWPGNLFVGQNSAKFPTQLFCIILAEILCDGKVMREWWNKRTKC